jgi:hypothetical protein
MVKVDCCPVDVIEQGIWGLKHSELRGVSSDVRGRNQFEYPFTR